MQFIIKLEISDEGGYTAQCLELPAAISEGDTKEDAWKISGRQFNWFLKSRRSKLGLHSSSVKRKIVISNADALG